VCGRAGMIGTTLKHSHRYQS